MEIKKKMQGGSKNQQLYEKWQQTRLDRRSDDNPFGANVYNCIDVSGENICCGRPVKQRLLTCKKCRIKQTKLAMICFCGIPKDRDSPFCYRCFKKRVPERYVAQGDKYSIYVLYYGDLPNGSLWDVHEISRMYDDLYAGMFFKIYTTSFLYNVVKRELGVRYYAKRSCYGRKKYLSRVIRDDQFIVDPADLRYFILLVLSKLRLGKDVTSLIINYVF